MLTILQGNCLEKLRELPDASVQCCVTSPPYYALRDYGHADQIGKEDTLDEYIDKLVAVFREVRRVLKDDGTLWLNLGDSYAGSWGAQSREKNKGEGTASESQIEAHPKTTHTGSMKRFRPSAGRADGVVDPRGQRNRDGVGVVVGLKPKDLIGVPWRMAFTLQADGWWLREDIIWAKPNCMPESVTDRCTRSHEYIFHLSKSATYYHDAEAIKEPAIYEIENSHGSTKARKARAQENHKSMPTGERNGIRPAGFKDARDFAGKNGDESGHTGGRYDGEAKPDKQRGHSRRHDGFNDRWDKMEKEEQCSGMRNKRSVWTVAPANYPDAHFATFPEALIQPCILAGCPTGGVVLDPFGGSGTTGKVALELGRQAILCELNPEYVKLIRQRCETTVGLPFA